MFSAKKYYVGVVIIFILLFLFYKGYQFTKQLTDVDNMTIEQIEAFFASQGVDLQAQHLAEMRRNIEQVDFLFKDILNEEQINRLKSRETEELNFYEENGLTNEDVLNERMTLTLNTVRDLFVAELVVKHLEIFYRTIIYNYNRQISVDYVSPFIANWMEKNIPLKEQIQIIRKGVERRTHLAEEQNEVDKEILFQVRTKLINDIDQVNIAAMDSSGYLTRVKNSLEEFDTYNFINHSYLIDLIARTYHQLGELLNIEEVTPLLVEWYNQQFTYSPIPIDELAENSMEYIKMMKKEGLLNERKRKELEKIITTDIHLFRHENDTTLLMNAIHKSLSELKNIVFDTEDREYFSYLYYQLATHKNMNISHELNQWLYGSLANDNSEKNNLPWE